MASNFLTYAHPDSGVKQTFESCRTFLSGIGVEKKMDRDGLMPKATSLRSWIWTQEGLEVGVDVHVGGGEGGGRGRGRGMGSGG